MTRIITVDQPNASSHKAGWLGFGPDGHLYAALGDGGANPSSAQDLNSLLGKILRLDVSADAFPGDSSRFYTVPADNPFVGVAGLDEIWALGLRNPWRDSFDRGSGEFFVADVGQSNWEEVNLAAAGANFGWPFREGPAPFMAGTPTAGTPTEPTHFYDHTLGRSITGGYVYRGGDSEGLHGQYFFADFSSGQIFTIRFDGTNWVATQRTSQIAPNVSTINNPSSFGEDALGRLYVVDFDGEVFRLTPAGTSADQADTINGQGGNDVIFGGSGSDTINGGAGHDILHGGPEANC